MTAPLLPALGLSLAAWLVMALTNLLVMLAVGLPPDARAAVWYWCWYILAACQPCVPGNIGPFHFFSLLALSLVGVSGVHSAAFALFLHALVTLPPFLLSVGLVLFSGGAGGLQKHRNPRGLPNDLDSPAPEGALQASVIIPARDAASLCPPAWVPWKPSRVDPRRGLRGDRCR